jgi:hypothetical protein
MNSSASSKITNPSVVDVSIRLALVALALGTAYIHATLGGLMFLANAAGFATLAVAVIVPVGLAIRFRGLIELALGAFASATIGGWLMFGARYSTAYIATGIEVAIVALVAIAVYRTYGNPVAIVRSLVARLSGPSSVGAAA